MHTSLYRRFRVVLEHQHRNVYTLVAGLTVLSIGVWAWLIVPMSSPDTPVSAPWWAVAIGFMIAESFVVNIHFRSESGSFSLLEIPLVFGLLFTRPALLWVAAVVGVLVGLTVIRRQPFLKVAFNVVNLSLQVGVASVLFSVFLGLDDPLSPAGWLAAVAATTMSAVLQISMMNVVIWITERRFEPKRAWLTTGFGSLMAAANTVQGLIAALIIVVEPWGVVLLGCSTAMLFVAYRAYVSERDHREKVEFLHNSTRALRDTSETSRAAEALLVETTSMFRARTSELVLFAVHDSPEPAAAFMHQAGTTEARVMDVEAERRALAVSQAVPRSTLVVDRTGSEEVLDYLAEREIGDAMIGILRSEQRSIGLLVVGDRLGNVTTFTSDDLRLFEALVDQAAVALENDQLEQTLSQLRELESELALQARYDSLTGLANRSLLNTELDNQIRAETEQKLDVLYIDLDDFKLVNDRLGHAAGDELLQEVAQRILAVIRPADLAARLGGDEFAVLLVSTPDCVAVANRIIGSLTAPFVVGTDEVRIGASVGIATWTGVQQPSELLQQADRAMYTAKERGKGSVVAYSSDLQRDDARQQALQTSLRRAISDDEFEVVYQPIVRLADLSIAGAEALVRWRRKNGLLVSPADFIAEAERSGLILSIDRLVRLLAFEQVDSFVNAGKNPDFFVSINLSARHLQQPELVEVLASDLSECDVSPVRIVLEITESAFAGDLEQAASVLDRIRRLGVRIALDDFGTGYSSLSYIRDLPIDILKIARPFVSDLATSNNSSFVQAITTLSRTLSLTIVAEGIENQAALDSLMQMDCQLGQGFYFAKPMPAQALETLLSRRSQSLTIQKGLQTQG